MKFSLEEKEFIRKIKILAKVDEKTVHAVFSALLMVTSLAIFEEKNEIVIPFLCKLKLLFEDQHTSEGTTTKVTLEAKPLDFLIKEIQAISEGETSPSEQYIKKQIFTKFYDNLELDHHNIEILE